MYYRCLMVGYNLEHGMRSGTMIMNLGGSVDSSFLALIEKLDRLLEGIYLHPQSSLNLCAPLIIIGDDEFTLIRTQEVI